MPPRRIAVRKLNREQLQMTTRDARVVARRNSREVCGLLVDSGYALELVPIRNAARRPGRFVFDARQVRSKQEAVRVLGHEIVGTYHSHPDSLAAPGPGDIAGTLDDCLMLIIPCAQRRPRLWHIKSGQARAVPYTLC